MHSGRTGKHPYRARLAHRAQAQDLARSQVLQGARRVSVPTVRRVAYWEELQEREGGAEI